VSQHPIPVLLYDIIQDLRARNPDRVPLVGVAGAQGSGKSYQCRILAMTNQPRFVHFSLDDVYQPRDIRIDMMVEVHPRFITRGPPGTHDLSLANRTLDGLLQGRPVRLPRFDKATDDQVPQADWPIHKGLPEAVLMDGWCLGADPLGDEALGEPINEIEAEDASERFGYWRRFVKMYLAGEYQTFFDRFDAMIYLRPPSWEIVRAWRGQQEVETLGRPLTSDEETDLDRFVMHYERITRAMMDGHHRAKWIVHLDEARKVTRIEER
jgi:D-glycerate 3-kinase